MYDKLSYGEFKMPSLQEMMIAPQYLTQQHEQTEQEFLASQTMAADAATRFQPGVDDKAIMANQEFQQNVEADVNDLAKNGLTPGIRRRLLQRKVDFNNNILPLNKAAVDREQWAKVAREAQLKDPSLMVRDPMQVGLDRWIADPTSRELNPISGREIYERTRQEMIPISKYVSEKLPQLSKTGIPFKYWALSSSGANPVDIANAMSRELGITYNEAAPLVHLIKGAADRVIKSTGVYDYYGVDSPEAARSWDYAESAYNHALGTSSVQGVTDDFNMRLALERAKARAAGGKSTKLSGLYFADRLGAELDVPEIARLKKIRDFYKDPSNGYMSNVGGRPLISAVESDALQGFTTGGKDSLGPEATAARDLKTLGIDVNNYANEEELLKAIDKEIDSYGKKYGYTTFDDADLKKGFLERVLPSLTSGSLQVFDNVKDAVEGKNPLKKSKWFGKSANDLASRLNDKDKNNWSIEFLDNQGVLRVRDGKETFVIRPEDIDQSEVGYYRALREVRSWSDDRYQEEFTEAYDKYQEAKSIGDEREMISMANYLQMLADFRDSTIPARTKTAAVSSGVNKAIEFKMQ